LRVDFVAPIGVPFRYNCWGEDKENSVADEVRVASQGYVRLRGRTWIPLPLAKACA